MTVVIGVIAGGVGTLVADGRVSGTCESYSGKKELYARNDRQEKLLEVECNRPPRRFAFGLAGTSTYIDAVRDSLSKHLGTHIRRFNNHGQFHYDIHDVITNTFGMPHLRDIAVLEGLSVDEVIHELGGLWGRSERSDRIKKSYYAYTNELEKSAAYDVETVALIGGGGLDLWWFKCGIHNAHSGKHPPYAVVGSGALAATVVLDRPAHSRHIYGYSAVEGYKRSLEAFLISHEEPSVGGVPQMLIMTDDATHRIGSGSVRLAMLLVKAERDGTMQADLIDPAVEALIGERKPFRAVLSDLYAATGTPEDLFVQLLQLDVVPSRRTGHP
jgi:hypothetical protein